MSMRRYDVCKTRNSLFFHHSVDNTQRLREKRATFNRRQYFIHIVCCGLTDHKANDNFLRFHIRYIIIDFGSRFFLQILIRIFSLIHLYCRYATKGRKSSFSHQTEVILISNPKCFMY